MNRTAGRAPASPPPTEPNAVRREVVAEAIFNEVMRLGGTSNRKWGDRWVTEGLRDKYRLEADAAINAVRIFDTQNRRG